MEGYNCIGCSPDNPFGLHLCFYEDGDDIVTTWKPSSLYQGQGRRIKIIRIKTATFPIVRH